MSYISELRKLVGHAPLMSTAATGIIYDPEKGVLLQKRADNGDWCFPGGALEIGESLEEALERELKEETGLTALKYQLFDVKANVYMHYPNGDEVYYTDAVYLVTQFEGEPTFDEESLDLRWFPLDHLPDQFSPTQLEYRRRFLELASLG